MRGGYRMHVVRGEFPSRSRVYLVNGEECTLVKFHAPCTGCYETEDGHAVGNVAFHPKHKINLGAGCGECRGRGFTIQQHYVPIEGRKG